MAVQTLSDALLASYITVLHETGKSPATIAQVVAAVKWQLKNQTNAPLQPMPIEQATLAGIRREGRDRGRGQVDGLIWQDVERVCIHAEAEGTLRTPYCQRAGCCVKGFISGHSLAIIVFLYTIIVFS